MCLAQGHNIVMQVKLEPTTLGLKLSTLPLYVVSKTLTDCQMVWIQFCQSSSVSELSAKVTSSLADDKSCG